MAPHAFRLAVEARDLDAMRELLADDVVFNSPVAHKPFEGRQVVAQVLAFAVTTFEDFRYVDEVADGDRVALIFRARVGDRDLQGLDFVHTNTDGLIDELTVMVRPMSGLVALGEAMGAKVAAAGLKG
jgi:ketosteroid isomerase-like protein